MSDLKALVGEAAASLVENGMRLGIGTGSTAEAFVHALAKRVDEGLDIIGVPTSDRTAALCEKLGVKLTTLDACPRLDLTIDGADEIGPGLNLIKGGGGAHLKEKIVATASDQMLVIADQSKIVDQLGAFALPIEVLPFGLAATKYAIEELATKMGLSGPIELRGGEDAPFVTDGGHYIFDASFGRILDPEELCVSLNQIAGVIENGLFIKIADKALVSSNSGVETLSA